MYSPPIIQLIYCAHNALHNELDDNFFKFTEIIEDLVQQGT